MMIEEIDNPDGEYYIVLDDASEKEPSTLWDIHPNQINMKNSIIEALKNVQDSEIPTSVYNLGLFYKIKIDSVGNTEVVFTLTTPNCPEAETLPYRIESALLGVKEIPPDGLSMILVWEPEWKVNYMPNVIKMMLGIY